MKLRELKAICDRLPDEANNYDVIGFDGKHYLNLIYSGISEDDETVNITLTGIDNY